MVQEQHCVTTQTEFFSGFHYERVIVWCNIVNSDLASLGLTAFEEPDQPETVNRLLISNVCGIIFFQSDDKLIPTVWFHQDGTTGQPFFAP